MQLLLPSLLVLLLAILLALNAQRKALQRVAADVMFWVVFFSALLGVWAFYQNAFVFPGFLRAGH